MKSADILSRTHNTGVIHGRFQILHNDHMKYLTAGKALCEHLVIGITNPDPAMTKTESADPGRSRESANPLTYYERYVMIKAALADAGFGLDVFSIVPFPINHPDLYKYYVPMNAVFFLSIYDDWGRRKLRYFRELRLKTHVLWEVPPEQKGISAETVRQSIVSGESWEHLVPPAVHKLLTQWNITKRLA